VIAFANGDIRPNWSTRAYAVPGGAFVVLDDKGQSLGAFADWRAEALVNERIDEERVFAAAMLDAAAAGSQRLLVFLQDAADRGLTMNVRMMPAMRFVEKHKIRGPRARVRWEIVGSTPDSRGWTLFAGALLAQVESNDTDISRCKLATCRRFFVIKRGELGKVRRHYCSPEHRIEQHARESADRQRRSRAARRKQARRPK
jgi:hypothetical protein